MNLKWSIYAASLLLIACGSPSNNKNTVVSPNSNNKEAKSNEQNKNPEKKATGLITSEANDLTGLKPFNGEVLAFYNVENLFDTKNDPKVKDEDFLPNSDLHWTAERYSKKLNNIADVADKLKGDLPIFMGMVEVENRSVLEDLISKTKLKSGNYGISHKNSPDIRGIDVALIYRKEYAKLLSSESLRVSIPNTLTRDILYTKFELEGKEILHTFVNHWPSRRKGQEASEYKRVQAAKTLKTKVDQILKANPNANIVIMGDFNDYPNNKSLKSILKAGTDTRKLYNLAYKMHMASKDTQIGTHSYKGEWGMLDQIIVSPNMLNKKGKFGISQDDFDVFYEDFLIFQHPKYKTYQPNRTYAGPKYIGGHSDHLPVYVEL
ncbi:MAG: endonuclease/exonuclease/phosphatase family protein [Flavobacteriales bacterium]